MGAVFVRGVAAGGQHLPTTTTADASADADASSTSSTTASSANASSGSVSANAAATSAPSAPATPFAPAHITPSTVGPATIAADALTPTPPDGSRPAYFTMAPLPGAHEPLAVVACAVNSPLFDSVSSDVHAEAGAVAECARSTAHTLEGTCCYVTRAPCVHCYKQLARAGVARICSPRGMDSHHCIRSAARLGIECVALPDSPELSAKRDAAARSHTDMAEVKAQREERKRARAEKKGRRKVELEARVQKRPRTQEGGGGAEGEGAREGSEAEAEGGEEATKRSVSTAAVVETEGEEVAPPR